MADDIVSARSFDLAGGTATLHIVTMPERARSERPVTWVMQTQVEKLLFDTDVANGRICACALSNHLPGGARH